MNWFGLPKRTEYTLRSLACMARSKARLPVHTIAACEHIPPAFLAQILYQLTWHGLVSSKRGPGGGFALALPPQQIQVKRVLEILQAPAARHGEGKPGHDFSQAWDKFWEPTRQALETLTLADLLVGSDADGCAGKARRESGAATGRLRSRRRRAGATP